LKRERVARASVKRRLGPVGKVVGYSPEGNEVSVKAEESQPLENVTRERLVKI
jgi:hypothetical protein